MKDTTFDKFLLGIFFGLLALIAYNIAVPPAAPDKPLSGFTDAVRMTSMSTVSSAACGPQVPTRILATSTARQYAIVTTGSTPVFLSLSDASSTTYTTGIILAASSSYAINSENLYTGSITCSALASTTLGVTAQQ